MGNFIDPARAGMVHMAGTAWSILKKEKKESLRIGSNEASPTEDTSAISQSAYEAAEQEKTEGFRQSAIQNLSQLDSSSETFLEEATDSIVGSALEKEFGGKMSKSKGFKTMKNTIVRQILSDTSKRESLERFIESLMPAVQELIDSGTNWKNIKILTIKGKFWKNRKPK